MFGKPAEVLLDGTLYLYFSLLATSHSRELALAYVTEESPVIRMP